MRKPDMEKWIEELENHYYWLRNEYCYSNCWTIYTNDIELRNRNLNCYYPLSDGCFRCANGGTACSNAKDILEYKNKIEVLKRVLESGAYKKGEKINGTEKKDV